MACFQYLFLLFCHALRLSNPQLTLSSVQRCPSSRYSYCTTSSLPRAGLLSSTASSPTSLACCSNHRSMTPRDHQRQCRTALRLGAFAPPRRPSPIVHPFLHHLQSCSWDDNHARADRRGAPRLAQYRTQPAPNDRGTGFPPALCSGASLHAFPPCVTIPS